MQNLSLSTSAANQVEDELTDVQVAAVMKLVVEQGFGRAPVEQIAQETRLSTKTIYRRYGGKAGLFEAAVQRVSERNIALFGSLSIDADEPINGVLRRFGHQLAALSLSRDAIELQRVVFSEAARCPELAAAFYKAGPTRGLSLLTIYLRQQVEKGKLHLAEPDLAAETFVHGITAELVRRRLLGVDQETRADDISRRIEMSIQVILHGATREAE